MELYGLFVFILGMIIGSFLNVVIYRFNTGRGLGGRSMCFTCKRTLSWHELIPIVSYISQSGKCHGCKSKISLQYPIVEAITGFTFVSIFLKAAAAFDGSFWGTIFYTIFFMYSFSILIVIAVYDYHHQIIPDKLVWIFNVFCLISTFIFVGNAFILHLPTWQTLMAGPLIALPFFLLWFLSKGTAMGFGDVKLALGIGWLLGISSGLSAVVVSFWIGGLCALVLLIARNRKYKLKSHIAFGPFLIISTFFVYLFNVTLKEVITLFN